MHVRSLKLENRHFVDQWSGEIENCWTYRDFVASPEWRKGWISFDCAFYDPDSRRVYLGLTCFDASRIFAAYDRASGRFIDLGYGRVANSFDAKLHRSLVKHGNGRLYAAPGLLHCSDNYLEAPGAAVVEYDPAGGAIRKLGVVLPHVYIQAVALDCARDTLYCQCFAPEYLASFDLRSREARTLGLLGSGYGGMAQGENIVLDGEGCVWCGWSLTRAWQGGPGPDAARLAKYDPRDDRVRYFEKGPPCQNGQRGFARVESFFHFGNGWVYASGNNGSFYRIDPATGEARLLFTPTPDRPSRLASLAETEEGIAYGVTGRGGRCELIRVHYTKGAFEKLGPIVDADGAAMYQCHDIVAAEDGTLYACENDNPRRSSYLWEIHPE